MPAPKLAQQFDDGWWMGQVVFGEGGAKDPRMNNVFQVAHVHECITWVNGEAVTHVVRSLDGQLFNACGRLDICRKVCEGCHHHDCDNHSSAKESDVWIAIHLLLEWTLILATMLYIPLHVY